MSLRLVHVRFNAGDLCLQGFDTCVELLDRHGVEVLSGKFDQRVAGLAWEEVFQVHCGIVDP